MSESLVTPDEIAKFLQISKFIVLKLCREKEIPHLKVGGRYRFDRKIIDEWVKTRHEGSSVLEMPRVVRRLRI